MIVLVIHSNDNFTLYRLSISYKIVRGCRGRNHMIVGFTTTYADVVSLNLDHGEVYNIVW